MPQAIANVGLHYLEHPGGPDSIFEKLGGQEGLEKFVDGFYDMMAADKDMKKFFENRNLTHLKKRTVDYLGGLWGGKAYRGPDLFLAHTGLGVTVKIFDLMMKCVEKQLKAMKVSKALSKQIVSDIQSMRESLCDPTGKLAKEQNAKNLALGDPFDDAANRAAYAEMQRKEEERRQKLIDFRKRKEAEAKANEKTKKEGDKAKDGAKGRDANKAEQKEDPKAITEVERRPSVGSASSSEDSARMAHLTQAASKASKENVKNHNTSQEQREQKKENKEKKDKSDRRQGSKVNLHLIKAKVEKNSEVHSGDSGLYSMETTVGNRTEAFSERCEAAEAIGDSCDDWSSVDEESSVASARSAGACEMMDWRWSPNVSPWTSPTASPVATATFEDGAHPSAESGVEEPQCPKSVQLLMPLLKADA